MRNFAFAFGCVLVIYLITSPFAIAQVDLTVNNNCGTGCTPPVPQGTVIGSINVVQNGADSLTVTLTMNAGFTLKIQDGNDFNFNGPAGLTISGLSAVAGGNTYNNLAFGVSNGGGADGFGKFGYNITGIGIPGQNGITSVSSLTFTITSNGAITPADIIGMFNAQGADFAIHFCDSAGTNCSPFTGYVANGQASVPEPPVTALLACSALVFGGFLRRRVL